MALAAGLLPLALLVAPVWGARRTEVAAGTLFGADAAASAGNRRVAAPASWPPEAQGMTGYWQDSQERGYVISPESDPHGFYDLKGERSAELRPSSMVPFQGRLGGATYRFTIKNAKSKKKFGKFGMLRAERKDGNGDEARWRVLPVKTFRRKVTKAPLPKWSMAMTKNERIAADAFVGTWSSPLAKLEKALTESKTPSSFTFSISENGRLALSAEGSPAVELDGAGVLFEGDLGEKDSADAKVPTRFILEKGGQRIIGEQRDDAEQHPTWRTVFRLSRMKNKGPGGASKVDTDSDIESITPAGANDADDTDKLGTLGSELHDFLIKAPGDGLASLDAEERARDVRAVIGGLQKEDSRFSLDSAGYLGDTDGELRHSRVTPPATHNGDGYDGDGDVDTRHLGRETPSSFGFNTDADDDGGLLGGSERPAVDRSGATQSLDMAAQGGMRSAGMAARGQAFRDAAADGADERERGDGGGVGEREVGSDPAADLEARKDRGGGGAVGPPAAGGAGRAAGSGGEKPPVGGYPASPSAGVVRPNSPTATLAAAAALIAWSFVA